MNTGYTEDTCILNLSEKDVLRFVGEWYVITKTPYAYDDLAVIETNKGTVTMSKLLFVEKWIPVHW